MLNSGVCPAISKSNQTDSECLRYIADAMHGTGRSTDGKPLREALQGEAPGLSSEERFVLEDGQSLSSGIGALCTEGGKMVISIATFASALSAEALKAEVSAQWRMHACREGVIFVQMAAN